jgi:predicted nucleic acid-binding protein
MTTYFMDSSAISKGYVAEVGSTWIMSLIEPTAGHVIVLSQLAIVEVGSVVARKQRLGLISAVDAAQARTNFLLDVKEEYITVALDDPVLQRAGDLINKHPLRSLDALQLACAMEATLVLSEPHIFVCSDNNLLTAAVAEGFTTDNPLAHP